MAGQTDHPIDLLQDALDGRLDESQRAALDAHLATCGRCRHELAALRWTKAQLQGVASAEDSPGDLVFRLRQALDNEDRRLSETVQPDRRQRTSRVSVAYWLGAAAAIIIAIVWMTSRSEVAAPTQAAEDFRAVSSGSMPLEVQTTDPATLESRLQSAGLPFAARVFDFGMMKYSLVGGGVHRFQGRSSALFAYRSADGRAVVCQMYEGPASELPAPAERRRQNDIDFLVYREGALTVVFWQEGDVLCVLVADGDSESAIQLAFAKAVKV